MNRCIQIYGFHPQPQLRLTSGEFVAKRTTEWNKKKLFSVFAPPLTTFVRCALGSDSSPYSASGNKCGRHRAKKAIYISDLVLKRFEIQTPHILRSIARWQTFRDAYSLRFQDPLTHCAKSSSMKWLCSDIRQYI